MKATAEDFEWSQEKIIEAATTWANFNGFTADTCWKCKRTANVLAGGPGWFCVCGYYSTLPWSGHQIPHDNPDLGPKQEDITAAYKSIGR